MPEAKHRIRPEEHHRRPRGGEENLRGPQHLGAVAAAALLDADITTEERRARWAVVVGG